MFVLAATLPIFILVGLGFVLSRSDVLTREDFGGLAKFVVLLALPALVFRALASRPVAETIEPAYMAAYAIASLAVIVIAFAARRLSGGGVTATSVRAMGMVCPNSGFVGYPINLILFPAFAGKTLALNMAVENLVIIPLLLTLAESGRHGHLSLKTLGAVFARLARTPLLIALVAGLAWSLAGIPLPAIVKQPVDILAGASAAASLLVIGGMLARAPVSMLNGATALVVVGKLILHPLAALAALALVAALGLPLADPSMRTMLILTAAMPIMGIYPLLAMAHGEGESAAMAIAATTVMSFFTINIVMLALGIGG